MEFASVQPNPTTMGVVPKRGTYRDFLRVSSDLKGHRVQDVGFSCLGGSLSTCSPMKFSIAVSLQGLQSPQVS